MSTILYSVVGGMFAIILGMGGIIYANIGHENDNLLMRLDAEAHRVDRVADRENDIDRRLAVVESKTK